METPLGIAAEHPAYAGHFPGRPLLPGVVLLAEAMAAIARAAGNGPHDWIIANAKFLRAVAPGTVLVLSHAAHAAGGVRFEIRAAQDVVASGTLVPREPR